MYRHRENEISEFIVAVEKIKLCEDFIRLVEIRFYCMYFSESASSSPSPQKMVKCVTYLGPSQRILRLKLEKNFSCF